MKSKLPEHTGKSTQQWAKYTGAGIEMAIIIGVFVAMGWYLDKWLELSPLLTIIFLFLGLASAMYRIFKQLQ